MAGIANDAEDRSRQIAEARLNAIRAKTGPMMFGRPVGRSVRFDGSDAVEVGRDFYSLFRERAEEYQGREELTDEEKSVVAIAAGVRVDWRPDLSHGADRTRFVMTTEPCSVVRIDGKWRVVVADERPGSVPFEGKKIASLRRDLSA